MGLSEAPQAEGDSLGLSDAPLALPQDDAGAPLAALQPYRLERAIVITSIQVFRTYILQLL